MIEVAITHSFGAFHLDVTIEAGDGVTALFGRSGAGKTSILSAVAGVMTPDAGRIVVGGRVLFDHARGIDVPVHKRRIGTVFQDGRLFPHMTIRQNLTFAERFAHGPTDTAHLVSLLGLDPLLRRRPAALSGGEKQRVAIARALLARPGALLLDEPLASLDDARKAEFLPYLERLSREARVPILYVSHSLAEVTRLASSVVLIREGTSVAAGPISDVFADPEATAMMGTRDAGAVVEGTLQAHDAADGLTAVALSRETLLLPAIAAPVGQRVRVRLRARDVILARTKPEDLSTRNIWPVTVESLHEGEGPGALIALKTGQDRLLARVTRRAARALDLAPGTPCYAVLKAFSVPPEDITLLPSG
ncbi:MAG: molybdenum ABC transporter ATP-binding protein [Pseudomonadota bacterium]